MDSCGDPETERGYSPTRSTQEVLRRMSLNSPPSRTDNPRQIKRAKLLAGNGASAGEPPQAARRFAMPPSQTPMKAPPSRLPFEAPSPMPTWGPDGVNLRDASAGGVVEASDPSSYYPSFQLESLRLPHESSSCSSSAAASPSSVSPNNITVNGLNMNMNMEDAEHDSFAPPPSPARLKMGSGGSAKAGGAAAAAAAALEEVRRGAGGGGVGAIDRREGAVPATPLRRPGSSSGAGAGNRMQRYGDHSCSPVGSCSGTSSIAQGSPVKKKGVGRWRLSAGGGDAGGGGVSESPLRSNRNPFSPQVGCRSIDGYGAAVHRSGGIGQEDSMSMPAPAPRCRVSNGGAGEGINGSPMETGDVVDFSAIAAESGAIGKGDEGSFLRRVSTGSCVSLAENGGGMGKTPDVSKPSPCDVAAFVPITPYRGGSPRARGVAGGDGVPMSPVSDAGGGFYVSSTGLGDGRFTSGGEMRGRFVSDFEELEVIGSGSFGTVYKVRSRVDGCLYAVKCTRRQFKGEADRQNMLREVYALAAVCDAQDTINIVRYHQAWIEDERLYIQTELCETSLEKQLESGNRLEIAGVYAFLRQTLLGLEILHQHHLVHLDIKPGNIFVKNGQYKLGDFGLVTPVHVRSGTDVVEGDSRYMSKELLNDDHSNLTKCDVFSLGITLYEIISGRPLPPNGDEWQRLRSGSVGMPMGLPEELSQTLNEMMHPDPSRRPSAAELLRYPCLQSEMERQLNDQKSKLNKERTHNEALKLEVSALIQKQSQRSGRLSRTITWDNSYFSKSDPGPIFSLYDGSATSSGASAAAGAGSSGSKSVLGGTPPVVSRSGAGAGGRVGACVFGAGATAPRFGGLASPSSRVGGGGGGAGNGLASLPEKEPAGWSTGENGAGGPASFERLRQVPESG